MRFRRSSYAFVALLTASQGLAAYRFEGRGSDTTTYDYIVVGGGTAGCAVATRISLGLSGKTILLIEAGPAAPDANGINIPGMKGSTLGGIYDWNFTTPPQSSDNDRVWTQPRGKVLGGSSALNLMSWDRASIPEYDWASLGSTGWNWTTLLPAMLNVETFTPTSAYGNPPEGVGFSGPIKTIINRIIPKQQDFWIPTVEGIGLPNNTESLNGNPLGVMYQPSNIDHVPWNRSYAANGYLPIAGTNLQVLTNTRVAKINLKKSGSSYEATGVTLQNGTVYTAREEVILSAGSIQSPGLLELSGIGQQSVLAAAGIEQLINLTRVGENLQDHIRIQNSYQLNDNYTSFDELKYNATYVAQQLALYEEQQPSEYDYTGSGYLYSNWPAIIGSAAAENLTAIANQDVGSSSSVVDQRKLSYLSNSAVPQIEMIFSDGYTGVKGYPAVGTPLYGQNFFTLIAVVMHTLSRGSVHITSSNISVYPTFDPQYLSKEYDIEAAVQAAKQIRRIAQSPPLNQVWVSEYEPGTAVVPETDNDEQWRQYVINDTLSIYHPLGTCALLPEADGGVVGPDLIVYGTTNLRVVDASVIPVQISAHIQTCVYGIAERAAEFIIQAANGN